jgi:hypothetical protein
MEFRALRSTPAPNVKFNFLGLIVERVCRIYDPPGRWYLKNFEFIVYSYFSSWSWHIRSSILVHNGAPYCKHPITDIPPGSKEVRIGHWERIQLGWVK